MNINRLKILIKNLRKDKLTKTTLLLIAALFLVTLVHSTGIFLQAYAEEADNTSVTEENDNSDESKDKDTEIDEREKDANDNNDVSIPVVKVNEIEIDDYKNIITVDEIIELGVTALPKNAVESTIYFETNNPNVASINSSGKIKGISKGDATITIRCEDITRKINISVIGKKTTSITLNNDFLILKQESTFTIKATIVPSDAHSNLTYKSLNSTIASVSSNGVITALHPGETSILVSNHDMTVIISIIVNTSKDPQTQNCDTSAMTTESDYISEIEHSLLSKIRGGGKITIDHTTHPIITKEILKALADNPSTSLMINNEKYIIEILGRDVKNCETELITNIVFEDNGEFFCFSVNSGKKLPGKIKLILADDFYNKKYLYLYNASKEKYERISSKEGNIIFIDEPSEYLLTNEQLDSFSIKKELFFFAIIVGSISIIIYLVCKKRYIFW